MSRPLSCCIVILWVLLAGCAREVPKLYDFAGLPEKGTCRIAVLPFIDKGSYPRGAVILYKVFVSELVASGNFKVVLEGDIRELYKQLMIYPNAQPNQEQLEVIGGRLGAVLFIGGDILKMQQRKSRNTMETDLTFILRIYDGISGRVLWETYHRRQGDYYQKVLHFGRINTITGLARQMSREVIDLWFEKGMTPCPK